MNQEIKLTKREFLAIVASRILKDETTVFVGGGLPMIASMVAQKINCPNLIMIFEAGSVAPELNPNNLPLSSAETRTSVGALMISSVVDIFSLAQRGYIEYGFIGGAQIDKYGNINSNVIRTPSGGLFSLTGSGGGNDIASLCDKIIAIMPHEKRRFMEKVDFVTSPGFLMGNASREEAGLEPIEELVITDLGIFDFDERSKTMRLKQLHYGVKLEQVIENTGFDIIIPHNYTTGEPPTEKEAETIIALDPNKVLSR